MSCSRNAAMRGWVRSRQMMEEELEADKRDETHPLTSGKKAEVCN